MNKLIILSLISLLTLVGYSVKQEDKENGNKRAFYECKEPLDIDSSLFEVKPSKLYFSFNTDKKPKKLKSLGYVWLEDNPKKYFTAYLINTSKSTLSAKKQDGSLIMIQEALNENGKWIPIEYWVYSGCGNSYFNPLKLESGKYVMIPIKKYSGNFKTKIRLKLKTNSKVLYSYPFEGSIDKSQFKKETEDVNGILYQGPANYLDDKK
jgi:hypothetical protein